MSVPVRVTVLPARGGATPEGIDRLVSDVLTGIWPLPAAEVRLTHNVKGRPHLQGRVLVVSYEAAARTIVLRAQPGNNSTNWKMTLAVPRDLDARALFEKLRAKAGEADEDEEMPEGSAGGSEEETALREKLAELESKHERAEQLCRRLEDEARARDAHRQELNTQLKQLEHEDKAAAKPLSDAQSEAELLKLEIEEVGGKIKKLQTEQRAMEAILELATGRGIDLGDPRSLQRLRALAETKKSR